MDSDPARIGAYGIESRLSDGGTGPVYIARREDGTPVVVKVLAPQLAQERGFLDRLEAELDVLRRAAPFSVAKVVEIATRSSPPHVVVEFVDGLTLAAVVSADGPLPAGDTFRLAINLASALTGVHSVPTVFGGLKPSNVVLSERGLRLLDFGTARAGYDSSSHRRRSAGGVLGTPGFIAPELVLGRPPGPAADVFAWGAVVLFAATGLPPFGAGSTRLAIQRTLYTEPDLRELERPLRTLVRMAMRKDPTARLTAAELVMALLGVVGRPPVAPVAAIPRQPSWADGAGARPGRSLASPESPAPLEPLEPLDGPPPPVARRPDAELSDAEPAEPAESEPELSDAEPVAAEPSQSEASGDAPEPPAPEPSEPEPAEPEAEPSEPEAEPSEPEPEAPGSGRPQSAAGQRPGPAEQRFVRAVLTFVALVAVATPVVVGLSSQARADAIEQSQRLAADALALADQAPDLAGQLAVTAQRLAPSTEAAQALIAATVRQTGDHDGPVHGVAVNAAGTLVVTIGDDGAALWDATDPRQVSRLTRFAPAETALTSVAFSPVRTADGWIVATAGPDADASVQLWWVAAGRQVVPVATLRGHHWPVDDLAFSPDGALLASSDLAGTVRLWDVADSASPVARAVLRHDGAALSATFSPRRDLLVVGGVNRITTWDVGDPDHPVRRDTVPGRGSVDQVGFAPDGRTLTAVVSDGADSTVKLMRVGDDGTTNHIRDFGDAAHGAVAAGYTADGRSAVTVRGDGSIALWNLTDPSRPVRRESLTTQPDVSGVVLASAGDSQLLAVSSGSSVRLWQLDAVAAAAAVCARVAEPITQQQWDRYLPDRDFDPPCD